MHIEPTKGSKDEAEAYINKKPPFDEKGEQIMFSARHGEIKGRQGQRNDLEIIEELLHQGKTPNEIMDLSLQYRRHDKLIRDAYYRKRYKETPIKREVIVYWHVGESGTGKSFTEVELTEEYGEENIYCVSEYENGFLDKYSGQKILFMDELRGGIRYTMLLTLLDSYKAQLHSRYTNVYALWTEIHITSVYPPDRLYKLVDIDNPSIDTYEQLRRRINYIVYHFRHEDKYMKYQAPIKDYVDLEALHIKAMTDNNLYIEGMIKMPDSTQSPFEQIQI